MQARRAREAHAGSRRAARAKRARRLSDTVVFHLPYAHIHFILSHVHVQFAGHNSVLRLPTLLRVINVLCLTSIARGLGAPRAKRACGAFYSSPLFPSHLSCSLPSMFVLA